MKNYKPNLIPNNPKDGSFDLEKTILKNGGFEKYLAIYKKDGCRLSLGSGVKTRSLKEPKSKLVVERFKELSEKCAELNIILDGEFYMHGLKFNEIFRFFSKEDVTCPKYRIKLEKELKKDPIKFEKDYFGKDIDFLTTFHDDLKFWAFDAIILDRPDLKGFEERMEEAYKRLSESKFEHIEGVQLYSFFSMDELINGYEIALKVGYEGLVLVHKDHEYKFGRNTLNQGTLLKMKDDALEYDGIVVDVVEGTVVKEGTEKTTNELGRSVTSKKKGDRKPSGLAKGFLVKYDGFYFTVALNGFNNDEKSELLSNKENYIGKHFVYTGMKPLKDFPRHAFFSHWRDEK